MHDMAHWTIKAGFAVLLFSQGYLFGACQRSAEPRRPVAQEALVVFSNGARAAVDALADQGASLPHGAMTIMCQPDCRISFAKIMD